MRISRNNLSCAAPLVMSFELAEDMPASAQLCCAGISKSRQAMRHRHCPSEVRTADTTPTARRLSLPPWKRHNPSRRRQRRALCRAEPCVPLLGSVTSAPSAGLRASCAVLSRLGGMLNPANTRRPSRASSQSYNGRRQPSTNIRRRSASERKCVYFCGGSWYCGRTASFLMWICRASRVPSCTAGCVAVKKTGSCRPLSAATRGRVRWISAPAFPCCPRTAPRKRCLRLCGRRGTAWRGGLTSSSRHILSFGAGMRSAERMEKMCPQFAVLQRSGSWGGTTIVSTRSGLRNDHLMLCSS